MRILKISNRTSYEISVIIAKSIKTRPIGSYINCQKIEIRYSYLWQSLKYI